MIAGGKAANIAYLARRLNVGARLIAHVGDDWLADRALEPLQKSGVDTSAVRRVPGCATGASLISVRSDGDKSIILAANANDTGAPKTKNPSRKRSPLRLRLRACYRFGNSAAHRTARSVRRAGKQASDCPRSFAGQQTQNDLYSFADYLTQHE